MPLTKDEARRIAASIAKEAMRSDDRTAGDCD
jgi:hypothetical protein